MRGDEWDALQVIARSLVPSRPFIIEDEGGEKAGGPLMLLVNAVAWLCEL